MACHYTEESCPNAQVIHIQGEYIEHCLECAGIRYDVEVTAADLHFEVTLTLKATRGIR